MDEGGVARSGRRPHARAFVNFSGIPVIWRHTTRRLASAHDAHPRSTYELKNEVKKVFLKTLCATLR